MTASLAVRMTVLAAFAAVLSIAQPTPGWSQSDEETNEEAEAAGQPFDDQALQSAFWRERQKLKHVEMDDRAMREKLREASGLAATATTPQAQAAAEAAYDAALLANMGEAGEADAWLGIGKLRAERAAPSGPARSADLERASVALFGAYQFARDSKVAAEALARLSGVEEMRGRLTVALQALESSMARAANADLQERVIALYRKIGFKVTGFAADVDGPAPRLCATLNDRLARRSPTSLVDYLSVEPRIDAGIEISGSRLCVSGVTFGQRYTVTVKPGLMSAHGVATVAAETGTLAVPDRAASVSFRGGAYVLPKVGSRGLPLVTVNVAKVSLRLARIHDRNLAREIARGNLMRQLSPYQLDQLLNESAVEIWSGTTEPKGARNDATVSALPIETMMGERKPGIYVLVAEPAGESSEERWQAKATQWVIVSDIGLVAMTGADGLTVAARGLADAKPLPSVALTLLSRVNEPLGTATTDDAGIARFAPGLLRGKAGASPLAVTAATKDGDYVFLDIAGPAFDLSDRGVGGRPMPEAVDVFMTGERGVWRPGETAKVTLLLRDGAGNAAPPTALVLRLFRPDGVEARRIVRPAASGSFQVVDVAFDLNSQTGRWSLAAHIDPAGKPIAELGMLVEDFVPPRLELAAKTDATSIGLGRPVEVAVTGRFLYGAPAAGLAGEAEIVIDADPSPFAGFEGWSFGLAQEEVKPVRSSQKLAPTDSQGRTTLRYALPKLPETTRPLRATLTPSLFEPGGRPVNTALALPVRGAGIAIGVKPAFTGSRVADGAAAAFDVVALDATGKPVAQPGLLWELYEEHYSYVWFRRDGDWRWEATRRDVLARTGTVAATTGTPARFSVQPSWGSYRLEVVDAKGGAATSLRFAVGWSGAASGSPTPDKMGVSLDKAAYKPGDTARIRLAPPFAGEALIAVMNDRVHALRQVTVPKDGTVVEMTIPGASGDLTLGPWGLGAYVVAMALRPAGADAPRGPGRALGVAWLPVETAPRVLAVTLAPPAGLRPKERLTLPLQVLRADGSPAAGASVTVAAVDDGILQLTKFQAPAPEMHVFAKRRLGADIRDLYGRLIDGREGTPAQVRTGGDSLDAAAGPSVRSARTVALFAGPVAVDAQGRATVSFDVPEFEGRLRLMAMAADDARLGHAEATVVVRDPLVADLSLPRFMAPGDKSVATLSLDNIELPAGPLTATLRVEGAAAIEGATTRTVSLPEPKSGARVERFTIVAREQGVARIVLSLAGPGGFVAERTRELGIRPADPMLTRRLVGSLNAGQSLRLDGQIATDFAPGARTQLTASNVPPLDLQGLLRALDRYPYGCLEQTTSRALPLLYLSSVAAEAGIAAGDSTALSSRVDSALARVLSMQRSDGSFGLWSAASPSEEWLTAFVLDFMTRARESGRSIDSFAFGRGIAWLRNSVAASEFPAEILPARAYAWYVLARNSEIGAGALRAAADAHLMKMPTRLARAQLGAALAAVGDDARARRAFAAAGLDVLRGGDAPVRGEAAVSQPFLYASYGSNLRDMAAVIALGAESPKAVPAEALLKAADTLSARFAQARYTSTQEQTWLLLAARALFDRREPLQLSIDGAPVSDPGKSFGLSLDAQRLGRGLAFANRGTAPARYVVTTEGYPKGDLPPEGNGFAIERKWLTTAGEPIDLSKVEQGALVVGLIGGKAELKQGGKIRALVVDLLPAGFELENAAIGAGRSAEQFSWLPERTATAWRSLRDDRFVAAIEIRDGEEFALAYLMRAVTPGEFRAPAVFVEDMYRPAFQARGAVGRAAVVAK